MTVRLSAKLVMKDPGILGRSMTARAKRIAEAEKAARSTAASTATKATQGAFHYKRPANAPARPGRPSTGGKFPDFLQWKSRNGQVEFDIAEADAKVRYWIILEIGTGEKATIRRGGAKNPQGRPGKGAEYVRSVKAQRGREIAASLAFGTGPRGTFSFPGAGHGQQLYLRRALKNAPFGPRPAGGSRMGPKSGLYITREIQPEHFVRKGGEAGFRQYRTEVLAAARRTFAGKGYRP